MRARLTFVLLLMIVASVSAQQPASTNAAPRPKTAPAPTLAPTGAPAPSAADAAKIAEVLKFEKEMEAAVVRGDVTFRAAHGDG